MVKKTKYTVDQVVAKYSVMLGIKIGRQYTDQYVSPTLTISQYPQDEKTRQRAKELNELLQNVKSIVIENPANLGGRNAEIDIMNVYYPGHVATVSPSNMPFRIEGRCTSVDEAILPFLLERFRYCGSNVLLPVELERMEGLFSQYENVYKSIQESINSLERLGCHDLFAKVSDGIKLSDQSKRLISQAAKAKSNRQEFELIFPPESLTQLVAAKISLMDNLSLYLRGLALVAGNVETERFEQLLLKVECMLESHGHKSAVVFTMSDSSNSYPCTDYIQTRAEMGDSVSHVYIGNLKAASIDVHLKFSDDNGMKVVLNKLGRISDCVDSCVFNDGWGRSSNLLQTDGGHSNLSVKEEPGYVFIDSYDLKNNNHFTSIRNILKMIESSPTPVSLVVQKLDISHIPDITRAIKNGKINQIVIDQIDVEGPLVHKKCLQNLWEAATQSQLLDFYIKNSNAAHNLAVCCEDEQGSVLIQNFDSVAFFIKLRDNVRYDSDTVDFNQAYEESVRDLSMEGQKTVVAQANKIAAAHTNEAHIIFGEVDQESGFGQAILAAMDKTQDTQETLPIQSATTSSVEDLNTELHKHMVALKKARNWRGNIERKEYDFSVLFNSLAMTLQYAGEGFSDEAEKLFSDIMNCDESILKEELLLVKLDHVTELKTHLNTPEVISMADQCLSCEVNRVASRLHQDIKQELKTNINTVISTINGICDIIMILQTQAVRQPPKGLMENCEVSPVQASKCVVS